MLPDRCLTDPFRPGYDSDVSADALKGAYDALVHGDPEPLVALMDDEMLWTGRSSPWRFWRPAPS